MAAANFEELVARVQTCRLCPRMDGRTRVLSAANGKVGARILFVAEAPGRLGGDRWLVPLYGDQSGRNFERLLAEAGLRRDEIFVTNAVVCNPRDAEGRNAPPSAMELANCLPHLRETIQAVNSPVVVSLGAVALRALDAIEAHGLNLARDIGKQVDWCGRTLVPLYHPGPRALIHRPLGAQTEDYRQVARLLSGI